MGDATAGIDLDMQDGLAILRPWGTLDLAGAAQIRPQIDQVMSDGDQRSYLVDLQHVNFLDVSGLRELLRLRDTVRSNGGQVSIVNGKPQVKRVLEIVGRMAATSSHTMPLFGMTRL